MVAIVLVVWCLLSIPVGIVLGLSIREGQGARPRPAAGPPVERLAHAGASAEDRDAAAPVPGLPGQRRPASRQGQLHRA